MSVYELFWPTSSSLPILQYAARGLVPSSQEGKGVWIAKTENPASRDFEAGEVIFSKSCLGQLSAVQAEEEFLGCLKYIGSQLQCCSTKELSFDIV